MILYQEIPYNGIAGLIPLSFKSFNEISPRKYACILFLSSITFWALEIIFNYLQYKNRY